MDLVIWAADVGGLSKDSSNFGWCRLEDTTSKAGSNIQDFAAGIAADLQASKSVALGFECPLFVPVRDNPKFLTSARDGEGDRSWSASIGASVLAAGLPESVWVLEQVRSAVVASMVITPTFSWNFFTEGNANLFLWEAFVTGSAKGQDRTKKHTEDAEIAARAFQEGLPDIPGANAVTAQHPFSLIGAALLRAKLTTDLQLLFEPCLVIKAREVARP